MAAGRRWSILDTAPASSRSLAAFGQRSSRVVVLGTGEGVRPVTGGRIVDALRGDLAAFGREPFDLVLLWDLLNYFSGADLPALAEILAGHLRPSARVHLLITSSQRVVPPQPGRFEVLPEGGVAVEHSQAATLPAPRFTPWHLERGLQGFVIDRSVLLQSGLQEFVLRPVISGGAAGEAP